MRKTRLRWTAATIVVGGLLLGSAGSVVADTARVKARSNDTWRKVHTYIAKGDKVVWKNADTEEHDVTFYRGSTFSAKLPPGGEPAKKKFRRRGTSLYRCTLHSAITEDGCQGMCGFIHVS